MSVLTFKQSPARQRVAETKKITKSAVARRRRKPLFVHNGSQSRPVMLFRSHGPKQGHLTQADIDRVPENHVPSYVNQLLGKIVRGEIKRGFWTRLSGRFKRG